MFKHTFWFKLLSVGIPGAHPPAM